MPNGMAWYECYTHTCQQHLADMKTGNDGEEVVHLSRVESPFFMVELPGVPA